MGQKDLVLPQNSSPAISQGAKWWWRVLEREISCSQWECSACTHERSSLFSFWGGGGGVLVFFPCSQCVPIMFPLSSQSFRKWVPHHDPNSTWVF
jgi:hypothetical protein